MARQDTEARRKRPGKGEMAEKWLSEQRRLRDLKDEQRDECRALVWTALRIGRRAGVRASHAVMDSVGAILGLARGTVGFYLHGSRPLPGHAVVTLELLAWERATTPTGRPLVELERRARHACLRREAEEGRPLEAGDVYSVIPLLDVMRDGHPRDNGVWAGEPPAIEQPPQDEWED